MKKIKMTIVIVMITVINGVCLHAQNNADDAYFRKGDWLVGFQGSFNHINIEENGNSDSFNFFFANIGVSRFVTDNISLGIDSIFIYVPETNGTEAIAAGGELNAKYHFAYGKYLHPYVGVHAGYAWGKVKDGHSESDHLCTVGGSVGSIIPINDNVYLDFKLKYTYYDLPVNIDLDTIQFLVGLNIKL